MLSDTVSRALRYLIAQGSADHKLRDDLALTKKQIAAEAGISVASLNRYLSGERSPSADVNLRLQVIAHDRIAEATAEFKAEAERQGITYKRVRGLPIRTQRYKRPRRLTRDEFLPSQIIIVDVKGLDNAEVADVVRSYWETLHDSGLDWNIRFLVHVSVKEYFGAQGPSNKDIRDSIGKRRYMPMWIPPAPFVFVTQKGARTVRGGRVTRIKYPSADAVLGALNDFFGHSYADRIPSDFAFLKIAFIPITPLTDDRRTREQKRRGKR